MLLSLALQKPIFLWVAELRAAKAYVSLGCTQGTLASFASGLLWLTAVLLAAHTYHPRSAVPSMMIFEGQLQPLGINAAGGW